jgi:hypothetical protein
VSDASMTVGAFSVPPGAPTLAGISAARGRQCIEHGFNRPDLGSRFRDIAVLVIDVTPPVPTCLRIRRQIRTRHGLRIEDDEMVRISPRIVPGVVDETLADIVDVLFASVESDMDAARATVQSLGTKT